MSISSPLHLEVQELSCGPIQSLSFTWPTGVNWICGNEGQGKTTLLRLLAGNIQPTTGSVVTPEGGIFWVDLQDPAHDTATVQGCWNALRAAYPLWNDDILNDLAQALDMSQHLDKRLNMLSAGSRRKVMLVAALASGATVTLLDQPFTALDLGSIAIIQEFLHEAADHPNRTWIVADYTAPDDVPLASVLNLDEAR
jgi:ABC-type multidrug transport system ATPase subunit